MGTVLSAYDPRLDRRVALKLVGDSARWTPARRERVLREARALARISHPNVVPVHEVADLEDQVVLVMEYVEGQTLAEWVHSERPPWREVVRVYVQAARGLEAAHAAGFVHRDFKPSNAVLGADGRVRVIDFGLVRAGDEGNAAHDDSNIESWGRWIAPAEGFTHPLTRTGTLLGTPAYMAPEQRAGEAAEPAADVFAFCLSLAEALYGVRPPPIADGQRDPPPPDARAAPRKLWSVLARGLRETPASRSASMEQLRRELLATLRGPKWTAIAVATALVATGVAFAAGHDAIRIAPCEGGAARMEELWDAERSAKVANALSGALGTYGRQITERVEGTLNEYTGEWAKLHQQACLAHQRGEESALLLDRRMACLEDRRRSIVATVALLESKVLPDDPVAVVVELPALTECADRRMLPASQDQATEDLLTRVGPALANAAARERGGDYSSAAEIARSVLADPAVTKSNLVAGRAELQLGRALGRGGRPEAANEPLRRALSRAVAADVPEIAAEALARRVYTFGATTAATREFVTELEELAQSFIDRSKRATELRALLLNNAGVARRSLGDLEAARTAFAEAIQLRDGLDTPPVELLVVFSNLARITPDPRRRDELYARASQETQRALGQNHPSTLRARTVHAAAKLSPARRRDAFATVCAQWEQQHPTLLGDAGLCSYQLAKALAELDNTQRALDVFESAAADLTAANWRVLAAMASARAAESAPSSELSNKLAKARETLNGEQPWVVAFRAELDALQARVVLRRGDHRQAADLALRAVAAIASVDASGNVDWQATAADAKLTAAQALVARGSTRRIGQIRELLGQATAWYRTAGAGYESRLAAIGRISGRIERQ